MEIIRGLRRILSESERREVWKVLAFAVVTGLSQTLAVFSIMPFVAIVTNPETAMESSLYAHVGPRLGLDTARALLIASGAGVLVLILTANVLGALSLRRVQLTAWNINHYLTRRLLAVYLHRPYRWFLDRHSSGLTQNLLTEVGTVVQSALVPLMSSAVRGMEGMLIVILLLAVDPVLTLGAGAAIGIAYVLTYWGLRVTQERLGTERTETTGMRYRVTTEALGGVKEIKALGAEEEFVRRFGETGPSWVRAKAWTNVLTQLPRYALEVLSMGTVLAIVLVLASSGQELAEMLPTLVLFGFAGYKLVPAFHQVFVGASKAVNAVPAIRTIEDALKAEVEGATRRTESGDAIHMTRSLELADVTVAYPAASVPSLSDISVEFAAGERVGIIGPTGAGKTTFADTLLGLLTPEEGEIRVDGSVLDMSTMGRRWRAGVGYVPQEIFLSDDTVAKNIAFGVREAEVDEARVRNAAVQAQLDRFVRELSDGYATHVGERGVRISGGQRQRIGIARALYRNPSLLLLDEATSALDGATEDAVMEVVYGLEGERTVVIVTHRLSTVKQCDRILLLDRGQLVGEGTFEELYEESDLFRVMARGVGIE